MLVTAQIGNLAPITIASCVSFHFPLGLPHNSIRLVGLMNGTSSFYWNYASAFTICSVGGVSAILCDILADNVRKQHPRENQLNRIHKIAISCLAGIGKVFQATTAMAMVQAAALSFGHVGFGLSNYKIVIIAVPILIEAFIANQKKVSSKGQVILKQIDASFGSLCMTASLISALIIAKKIGSFDLLPLAIISTSSYLTYKTVKIFI